MKKKNSVDSQVLNVPLLTNAYINEVKSILDTINKERIENIINTIFAAYRDDKTIYIIGNGGSASTASHMACDLGKGTLQSIHNRQEKRLRVISLTDNVAAMTAYANDISYDDVFIQQLQSFIKENDILIALSGSGNSTNILKAVSYAKKVGAITIGLLGFKTGGKVGKIVDIAVTLDSNHYGPIEDVHLIVSHLITAAFAKIKYTYENNTGHKRNSAVPFHIE